jgi:hypothetical protein
MPIVALLLLLFLAAVPVSATTIDTTVSDGGFVSGLSSSGWAYGQTFTATGLDVQLDSFSLVLQGFQPGTDQPMALRGFVAEWDSTLNRPGAALFQSDIRYAVNINANQEFSFTPDLVLTADHQYVAYLSTLGLESFPEQRYDVKKTRVDVLPGEGMVSGGASGPWGSFGDIDMWFKAQLSPVRVPEPGSLLLIVVGVVGLVGARTPRWSRSS